MKILRLKFKTQDFQTQAVDAVVDLFTGQEKTRSTFSVTDDQQISMLNEFGQGNMLCIDQETLTANMHMIQKRNNLPLTQELDELTSNREQVTESKKTVTCYPLPVTCKTVPQFCIEMETGTGKTYVYTKTIF